MKIMVFGIGKFFLNRKDELYSLCDGDTITFIDNRVTKKQIFEGRNAYNPSICTSIGFDKIVLMSKNQDEMKEQLIFLGVEKSKIFSWERYKCEKLAGQIKLYISSLIKGEKNVAVVAYSK